VSGFAEVVTHPDLSIDLIKVSLGVTSINIFTTSFPTSINSNPSTLATNCPGTNCDNVVREIILFFNSGDGSINSNSYLVVGPLTVNQAGYITIKYSYSFVTSNASATFYPY